jgi:hypothetical protein
MHKRRMIKAALTTATIAVAVALPVATASAATASPQVHTRVAEGLYPTYGTCVAAGWGLTLTAGSTGYDCEPALISGYILYSYFD